MGIRTRPVRTLILIMMVVVAAAIIVAKTYYSGINRRIDPRTVHARELYTQYDAYARSGDFFKVFSLLDSIEQQYRAIDHYRNSYETGVLYNNRAAACLTISLYEDSIPAHYNPFASLPADSIIRLAEDYALTAISIYQRWDSLYAGKASGQISEFIQASFLSGLGHVDKDLQMEYLRARVAEIEGAQAEHDRRVSVCLTNLGVIYRMKGEYEEAVKHYEMALSLWDRNLEAENNLNKLLNRPLKKRNVIQKLFPPDREVK
jgi:tetratricopeptide (TPR) repeat protein